MRVRGVAAGLVCCAALGVDAAPRDDAPVYSRTVPAAPARGTLVVRVRDARGAVVRDAAVVVRPAWLTGVLDPAPAAAPPDAEGYALPLAAGDWLVEVTAGTARGATEVHVDPGERREVGVVVR